MPSLGLLLEAPIFETYNKRVEGVNEKLTVGDTDYRPPVDLGIHADKIARFKQEHIYARMRDIEDRGSVYVAHLHRLL
jgi:tRNA pseudouridine38-40 synthase